MLRLPPRRTLSALLLASLIAGFAGAPPRAGAQPSPLESFPIVQNHDFDSGTKTYCLLGPAIDSQRDGRPNIKTTGSSATVDAASGTPFAALTTVPGAVITVRAGTPVVVPDVRYVLTKPSGAQITVDTAVDWSGAGATGFPWSYRNLTCGTGDGAGWFGVGQYSAKVIALQIEQVSLASGSLAVTIDGRSDDPWAKPTPIYPMATPPTSSQCDTGLFTTAGTTARCIVVIDPTAAVSFLRVGVSLTDDGGDTGANLEKVTARFMGRR